MSSRNKPTNVRWLVLGLASMTSLILYLHRYTWAIIRPQLEMEYGYSNTQLEQIFTLFQFSYALGQIPGGVISDIFGARLFLSSSILIWSVCLILFAMVGSFWAFGGVRLVFGAAQAAGYPSLSSISSRWFAPSSRTTFQGFISSFAGRMGGALGPLIMATVLMGYYGLTWRVTLIVMASLGIFFAAAFFVLFRNHPLSDSRVNKAEQEVIKAGAEPRGRIGWTLTPVALALPLAMMFFNIYTAAFLLVALALFMSPMLKTIFRSISSTVEQSFPKEDGSTPKSRKKVLRFAKAAKHRSYQILVAQQFANAGADIVYTSVLGSVFAAKGANIMEMGKYASLPLIGGAIGGYAGGYLNDFLIKQFGIKWGRKIMGFLGKAIAAGCLFIALSQSSAEALAWGLFVVKFFSDWSQPTVWGTCTDLGGRNAGTVFSIVNMTGNVGALSVPLVVGPLLDHFSTIQLVNGVEQRLTDYEPMFLLVAALYLVCAFAWLFIDCSNPIDPEITSKEN